ncbi:MAG: type II secretion system protein GspM [Gammaproteobacteria bacterium]|jgi:general secretion pathway protein M
MQWWQSLQPRERLILGTGSVVAVLIVLWEFAWQPFMTDRVLLQTAIFTKQQMIGDLARAGALEGPQTTQPRENQSLFVLIDQTAQASGLAGALTRARPNGSDEISVTFSNAPFDSLVAWLIALNENNGIYVDGASINTSRQQGLVSGQLLLRRG